MMLDVDAKEKKRRGAEFFELPDDLAVDDWVKNHHAALVEEQRQKITKKFEKDNEKLKANGEKEMKKKELDDRLEEANELEKKFKKELKTGKVEAEGKGPTVEKLAANLEKLDERIRNMSTQAEDKESNKEVALGTSKIVSISFNTSVYTSKPFLIAFSRTISTPVSPSSSPRNSTSPSSASSPRRSATSSSGQ